MCLTRIELEITVAKVEIDEITSVLNGVGCGVLRNLLPITHFERRTQGSVHNSSEITSHHHLSG